MNLYQAYKFLASFLYPAMLGAAIAWWVQGASATLHDESSSPDEFALSFGMWFMIYHSVYYWHVLTSNKSGSDNEASVLPPGYTLRNLITDVVDVVTIIGAFMALGLTTGQYHHMNVSHAYLAVTVIIGSAFISNFKKKLDHPEYFYSLFLASFTLAIAGVWIHWGGGNSVTSGSWAILADLSLLLLVYIFFPDAFQSRRSKKKG